MSRRRSPGRAQSQRPAAPAVPPATVPAAGRDPHLLAEERRRARVEARTPGPGAPVVAAHESDPADELHRRAVELREVRMGRRARPVAPSAVMTSSGTASIVFPVTGMTCRSCEVRIGRFVGRLPGVERVSASAVRGQVTVECSASVPTASIEAAIRKAGYELGRAPWLVRDPVAWGTAAAGSVVLLGLVIAAQVAGLGDLAGAAGDVSRGGLVVALLLGLAAGVSTCMALVGGLVLGLSATYQAGRPEGSDRATQMRPALVLVGGRIVGYAAFGALLGALGASIAMPPQLTAVLMIGVGGLMLLLGTRLTGLSPRLAGWSPTLPAGLGRRLGLTSGGDAAYSDARAASLGALTFFLPCGFTQAIQVFALSTGSPLYAAALLGVFALGTAPGLLALAGLPLVVPPRTRPALLRLVGVLVIGFALLNASAGLRLSGLAMPSLVGTANAADVDPAILGADGVERITTYQNADGYSPSNITIYAGYPVVWTVQSSTTATCAASLFAPGVDIRARLEEGPNTFRLPPLPAGVLRYSCSMGMYGAQITVVPRPAGTGPAESKRPSTDARSALSSSTIDGMALMLPPADDRFYGTDGPDRAVEFIHRLDAEDNLSKLNDAIRLGDDAGIMRGDQQRAAVHAEVHEELD